MPSEKGRRPDALTVALKYLASRPRSVSEVRERLGSKGFDGRDIDDAVAALVRAGYLDDGRFAETLCGSRVRYRNWGPVKIACELKGKGVSEDLIRRALGSIGAVAEARTAAVALKKWARRNGISLPVDRRDGKAAGRAFRFLKGRGFSSAVISRALDVEEGPDNDGAEG